MTKVSLTWLLQSVMALSSSLRKRVTQALGAERRAERERRKHKMRERERERNVRNDWEACRCAESGS